MKKFLFLVFLILPISAFAGKVGDNIEYAGYLKTEVWVRNHSDNDGQYLTSLKDTDFIFFI